MRVAFLRTVSFLNIALVSAAIGNAGPSFNSERKDLDARSREAGAALQRALSDMHLMLASLEVGRPDQAQQIRADALKNLDSAIESYKQIAQIAPQQTLVTQPQTDLEKRAVDTLPRALQQRKMEAPKTERDLAQLAVTLVVGLRAAIADSPPFDKTSIRAYAYFQKLFQQEGFLLNVGIYASVIWAMQDAPR